MIVVIRISGLIGLPREVSETLHRIRLRRKYSAVLMQDTPENKKLLSKVRNHVAFGKINEKTLEKLLEERGKSLDGNKIDTKKVISEIEKQGLSKLGLKPFFRLHPPRGGIDSKKHFGVDKGVLGDNKENINQLLERML